MNLVRNRDGTWAIVSDDDVGLVSGLPTATAVQRWARAALHDPELILRHLQSALADEGSSVLPLGRAARPLSVTAT